MKIAAILESSEAKFLVSRINYVLGIQQKQGLEGLKRLENEQMFVSALVAKTRDLLQLGKITDPELVDKLNGFLQHFSDEFVDSLIDPEYDLNADIV